jgi:hypothetical protein
MKPEAQRIAIAEACGWKYRPDLNRPFYSRWQKDIYVLDAIPPNYPDDLNAMHEAEKQILDDPVWVKNLHEICNSDMWGDAGVLHATAAQRAEAFLRTIGKWQD